MMRLVHFITSLEQGGAQAVLYDIVSRINEPGISHSIIYIHDGPYKKQFERLHIPIYHVRGLVHTYDPFIVIRLYRLLKKLTPDCVHTMLWSANWLGRIIARMLKIRCVVVLHNRGDLQSGIRKVLDCCAPEAAMIAVSHEVKRSFLNQYGHMTVIQNGVDVRAIQRQAEQQKKKREELGLDPEHFIIGSVGRFHPVKRYPLLLESFALLYRERPEARLVLIGAGDQYVQLEQITHDYGITQAVRFVLGQRAYGYYSLFDCFAQTSESEGISIALLEAMSCGVAPFITHSETTHPVVIHRSNGILIKSSNPICIIDSIKLLMDNPAMRKQLSCNAQETIAQRFTLDTMLLAYKKVFNIHQWSK